MVVTTAGWDATSATLRRFVRDGAGWRADGPSIDAVVGRGGLGWGRGLHGDGAPAGREGQPKVEGDGRAPAGVFWVRSAFGYAPSPPAGTRVPYARVTETWRCVDDPDSSRYNQVFDAAGVEETWKSAEDMLRPDDLYRWVVVIGHNDPPARPRGGSCIFFHVWSGRGAPTVGCTAMAMEEMEKLVTWIDPDGTVVVALPDAEYQALRAGWNLPSMGASALSAPPHSAEPSGPPPPLQPPH